MRSKNYIIKINGEFKEAFNSLSKANSYLKSYKNINDIEFSYEVVCETTVRKVVRRGTQDTVSAYDIVKD